MPTVLWVMREAPTILGVMSEVPTVLGVKRVPNGQHFKKENEKLGIEPAYWRNIKFCVFARIEPRSSGFQSGFSEKQTRRWMPVLSRAFSVVANERIIEVTRAIMR